MKESEQPGVSWPPDDHWIDRQNEVLREPVWRSSIYGTEYVAPVPEFSADVEVGYRDTVTTTGTLLGSFPELGTITMDASQSPKTIVEKVTIGPSILSTRNHSRHAE